MARAKPILLWVMAAFYILGGFNHLMNPEFYLAIMPPNLPNPEWLNLISGLAEIILGALESEDTKNLPLEFGPMDTNASGP